MGRNRKTGRMAYFASDINRRNGFPEEQLVNALRSAGLAARPNIVPGYLQDYLQQQATRIIPMSDFKNLAPDQQLDLLDQPQRLAPEVLEQIQSMGGMQRVRARIDTLAAEEKEVADFSKRRDDELKAQRRRSGGFSQREVTEAFNRIYAEVRDLGSDNEDRSSSAATRILYALTGANIPDVPRTYMRMTPDAASATIQRLKELGKTVNSLLADANSKERANTKSNQDGKNTLFNALNEREANIRRGRALAYQWQEMLKIAGRAGKGK